jgi:voltage-gated potassium channel
MSSATAKFRGRLREILDVANPGDLTSRVVDSGIIALVFLNVLAVVIETIEPLHQSYSAAFDAFETFSVGIFTVEYASRVWCAASIQNGVPFSRRFRERVRFVLTPMAIIDLLAILPFYLFHLGALAHVDMRFIRAFRLFRLFKLTRYSPAMTSLTAVLRESARPFGAALFILMIVILLAATGMYAFERVAQPVAFGSIPAAMWWAFATLTTVGYGDVTPITVGGKVFGALITVVGVGMVALPAGILASAYNRRLRQQEEAYRGLGREVYEDGIVTPDEAQLLEERREELGLSVEDADALLEHLERRVDDDALPETSRRCPHCGGGISSALDDPSRVRDLVGSGPR